ncbi:MAG TPA: DUF4382 domain-containing protein [Candidatus Babeliaceae bacterium]|nr:DUF4382 domain-containing protein [Candidatus Babeliaceae bacterium]HVZ97410.1 DUF4382 domain-containing protein [Chitinophagaceae bacterium]
MKTQRLLVLLAAIFLMILSMIFSACRKDAVTGNANIPPGKTMLSVHLLDAPADFQKVLIDIQGIRVKVDTCNRTQWNYNWMWDREHGCDSWHDYKDTCDVWDTLNINPGVYDLLTLQNGADTLLASGLFFSGNIERIKITLGSNDSVMVDSVMYPLSLFGNFNYVYADVMGISLDSITASDLSMYLDFNVERSILDFNGKYWLKPFVKIFGMNNTGTIEGKVRPVHSSGMIMAYNDTDTGYAKPDHYGGAFMVRGLSPGIYSLYIQGINGYKDTTLSNISVMKHEKTDAGTVVLHQ